MKRLLTITTAIVAGALWFAPTAYAGPLCTNTVTVGSGGSVTTQSLLVAGACVAAGDKIFGDFAVGGAAPATGSASFTFLDPFGSVTLGFSGSFPQASVGTLHYSVGVSAAGLAAGWLITSLQKDFTVNASPNTSGAASAELIGTTNPLTSPAVAIDCIRTANPSGGSCPQVALFAGVDSLTIDEQLTTAANSVVTALSDTIGQSQVPEPLSLAVLGVGLLGLGAVRRRV